jgi:DHA1 family inner membrane transport protein
MDPTAWHGCAKRAEVTTLHDTRHTQKSATSVRWALLFGNFVIGTGVLAPAGLINELSTAFAVDLATVGLLMAYGGAVLCIEAPILAFLTNRIDRRALLTGALVLYAVGHVVSAFATSFSMLLVTRLVMIGGAAVFTPQAASAIGLFIPAERRAGSVAFIFLGWSVATAVGIPLASLLSAYAGWSAVYLILGIAGGIAAVAVFVATPSGLRTPSLSVAAWIRVISRGDILLLLLVTVLFVAGQFTQYPYIAAALKTNLAASPQLIAILLALYGLAGVVGAMVTAGAIDRFGAAATVAVALVFLIMGLGLWSGSGSTAMLAIAGLVIWGLGGGPAISAQQSRFIASDPGSASASVSLNTSLLYAGQAMGTTIGGRMLAGSHAHLIGPVGIALIVAALLASLAATKVARHAYPEVSRP